MYVWVYVCVSVLTNSVKSIFKLLCWFMYLIRNNYSIHILTFIMCLVLLKCTFFSFNLHSFYYKKCVFTFRIPNCIYQIRIGFSHASLAHLLDYWHVVINIYKLFFMNHIYKWSLKITLNIFCFCFPFCYREITLNFI